MEEVSTQNHRISNSRVSKQFEHSFRSGVRSSDLSDLYKSPQLYAGLPQSKQSGAVSPWSPFRKIVLLAPCFAFHFIEALCALVSVLNIELLDASTKKGGLNVSHLIFGGILSVVSTVTFQRLARKFYGSRARNLTVYLLHFLYLLSGLLLVFAVNLESVMNIQVNSTDEDASNITSVVSPEIGPIDHDPLTLVTDHVIHRVQNDSSPSSSGWISIISVAGYTIMMSAPTSGQYLLASIAMSTSDVVDLGNVMAMSTLTSALGGCVMCILGLFNFPSGEFSPSNAEERHLLKTFHLICAAIGLLVLCTICCVTAWFSDVIARRLRGKQPAADRVDSAMPSNRKRTRTAQEIYDECAPLLGDPPHPDPCFQLDQETKELSHSETALDDSARSSNTDASPMYTRLVPSAVRLSRAQAARIFIKRQKNLACALLLVFLLASSGLSFEFSASVYMSSAESGACDLLGLDQACLGLFIMYFSFTALLCLYNRVTNYVEWKRLTIGFSLLAALWTWPLAISHDSALFYVVACIHGLFKVVSVRLHQMLNSQGIRTPVRFQKNTLQQILLENSTTAIWCTPALGLVVYALVTAPSFYSSVWLAFPMYYSTTAAFFSCLGLHFLL